MKQINLKNKYPNILIERGDLINRGSDEWILSLSLIGKYSSLISYVCRYFIKPKIPREINNETNNN